MSTHSTVDFKYTSIALNQLILFDSSLEDNSKNIIGEYLNNIIQSSGVSDRKLKESVFFVYEYFKTCNFSDTKNNIVNQLGSLVDKFPAFLTKISSSESKLDKDFINIVCKSLSLLIDKGSSELLSHITRTLSKLINTCCKICSTNNVDNINLGTSLLLLFAKSKVRPHIATQSHQIHKLCGDILVYSLSDDSLFAALYYNDKDAKLNELYALYLSVESPEQWSSDWILIFNEIVTTLGQMGINSSYDNKHVNKDNFDKLRKVLSVDNYKVIHDEIKSKKGIDKAMYLKKLFYALCGNAKQMLLCGCSSGPCQIDLSPFISIIDSLMPIYSESSTSDGVNLIQNDCFITPIDLNLVIPHLKIYYIEVIISLLSINHPSLIRHGKSIYRPIATLLSRKDTKQSPNLIATIIKYMSLTFQTLPNVVSNSFNSGGTALLDLFKSEMDILTLSRSLISVSSSIEVDESISGVYEINYYRSQLFEAVEYLLLFCGSMLSSSVRQTIESIIGQGLSCIIKGVRYPQFPDRKQHLFQCEIIRQDVYLQNLLIKLSTAELLCSPVSGLISGNVTLLKLVCECCSKHRMTVYEANKGLLVIGSFLHPCAVSFPAIPAADLARSFLERMNSIGKTVDSSNEMNNMFLSTNKDNNEMILAEKSSQNKRQRLIEESEKVNESIKKVSNVVSENVNKSLKKLDTNISVSKNNNMKEESDDDLELPDIIDADPDCLQ